MLLLLGGTAQAATDDLIGKAMIQHSLHHYKEAEEMYNEAFDQSEKQSNQKQMILALKGLGMLSLNTRENEAAVKYYKKAVDLEAGLSDVDDDTKTQTLINLAACYASTNHDHEAKPLFFKALSIARSSNNKLNQIITLDHLGTMYRYEGNLTEANKMSLDATNMALATYGIDSMDTALVMQNRAMILGRQCKYNEAEELLKKSLSTSEKLNGKDGLLTASINSNLALINLAQGKLKESENSYLSSIAARKKSVGENDPDVLVMQSLLARVYLEQGNANKALELGETSLKSLESELGAKDEGLFDSLIVMGTIYSARGDNKKALEFAQRALPMGRSFKALLLASKAYLGLSNMSEAEKYAVEAIDTCEQKYGPEHSQFAKCLEQLAKVKRSQHKLEEARALELRVSQIKDKVAKLNKS